MELQRKRIRIRKYETTGYLKEALRYLQPPEDISVSEWAEKYRILDTKTSAMPGPWRNDKTPYLKDVMDEFLNYETEEIIFCKCTQVGGTEAMQNMLGYIIQQDPSPTMVVYPTDKLAESISENRIQPMITLYPMAMPRDPMTGMRPITVPAAEPDLPEKRISNALRKAPRGPECMARPNAISPMTPENPIRTTKIR